MTSPDADPQERTRSDDDLPHRVGRILLSEDAVYGLILVSGMIVVSNNLVGTSLNALATVVVTVVVFFAAHVYARTISHMAASDPVRVRTSLLVALDHSKGLVIAAVPPLVVLGLGVTHFVDDDVAIWTALALDIVLLGVLGWAAVSAWTHRFWPRLASALITAGFGAVIAGLKALIH